MRVLAGKDSKIMYLRTFVRAIIEASNNNNKVMFIWSTLLLRSYEGTNVRTKVLFIA